MSTYSRISGTMVLSAVCHDSCNMIAALADGKFTVWYYPNAVFVDKDLLAQTVYEKGKGNERCIQCVMTKYGLQN